jgi:glycine betaine/proline transport system substrate-binding protein
MTPLKEPPYDKKIWDTTKACAYPSVKVNIAVNKSMPKKNPQVVAFLKNYETTTAMANKFLAYMQDAKCSTQEAAEWFLKNNMDVWTKWLPQDKAAKVKAALK